MKRLLTLFGMVLTLAVMIPGSWFYYQNRSIDKGKSMWVIIPPWSTPTQTTDLNDFYFQVLRENLRKNVTTEAVFYYGNHVNLHSHFEANGLTRSSWVTRLLAYQQDFENKKKPGVYYFSDQFKPSQIISTMVRGETSPHLMVVPGDDLSKIAEKLSQAKLIDHPGGFTAIVNHPRNLAKWKKMYQLPTFDSISTFILPGLYYMGTPELTDRDLEEFKHWGLDNLDKVRKFSAENIQKHSELLADMIKPKSVIKKKMEVHPAFTLGSRFNRLAFERFHDEIGVHFLNEPQTLTRLPLIIQSVSINGGAPPLIGLIRKMKEQ